MKIVKLFGGLGNQMFQYAAARSLTLQNNEELLVDCTPLLKEGARTLGLDCFTVGLTFADEKLLKRVVPWSRFYIRRQLRYARKALANSEKPIRTYRERHYHFDEGANRLRGDAYLDGYWQSEKYFSGMREMIRKDFIFKEGPNEIYRRILGEILERESVSIHIRRGDFAQSEKAGRIHGVLESSYYEDAVKYIANHVQNVHFYLFSDDVIWVRQNFKILFPSTIVERTQAVAAHEDMRLMSQCKHNILANSSFSWWAAWLNQNKKKIIVAPKKWFNDPTKDTKDLYIATWVQI